MCNMLCTIILVSWRSSHGNHCVVVNWPETQLYPVQLSRARKCEASCHAAAAQLTNPTYSSLRAAGCHRMARGQLPATRRLSCNMLPASQRDPVLCSGVVSCKPFAVIALSLGPQMDLVQRSRLRLFSRLKPSSLCSSRSGNQACHLLICAVLLTQPGLSPTRLVLGR